MKVKLIRGEPDTTRRALDVIGRVHDVVVVDDAAEAGPADMVVLVWPTDALGRRGAMARVEAVAAASSLAVVPSELTVDRLGVVDAGVDYIGSPFHPLELLHRLQSVSGSTQPRRPVWRAGDVVVDEAARTVERRGRRVDLTRKELDLLLHLVRHRGQVQERSVLLDAVWASSDFSPNVIEVAVSSLRRKLEVHGPRIIHTVRGIGYVCRADRDRTDGLSGLVGQREDLIADRQRISARRRALMEEGRARRSRSAADLTRGP